MFGKLFRTAKVSAGGFISPPNHSSASIPTQSPTLVNTPNHNNRPSVILTISGSGEDFLDRLPFNTMMCGPSKSSMLNSTVSDAAGRTLYVISSTTKRSTLMSCGNNAEVAHIKWNRETPTLVYHGKKTKCMYWLPFVKQESMYDRRDTTRLLTHGDTQFIWVRQGNLGYLIPADRPGLSVAKWWIRAQNDELRLQLFQSALVECGLLEAIVLSLLVMRSGYCLGDVASSITDYYRSVPQVPVKGAWQLT